MLQTNTTQRAAQGSIHFFIKKWIPPWAIQNTAFQASSNMAFNSMSAESASLDSEAGNPRQRMQRWSGTAPTLFTAN
jgi:hypothetical protein